MSEWACNCSCLLCAVQCTIPRVQSLYRILSHCWITVFISFFNYYWISYFFIFYLNSSWFKMITNELILTGNGFKERNEIFLRKKKIGDSRNWFLGNRRKVNYHAEMWENLCSMRNKNVSKRESWPTALP